MSFTFVARPRTAAIRAGATQTVFRFFVAAWLVVVAGLCVVPQAQASPASLHAQFTAAQSVVPTGFLYYPYRVAVDASGNVYISDTQANEVLKETLSGGVYTESVIASGLSFPYGVAVDTSGNVYIVNNGTNQVLLETPSGSGYTQSVVTTTTTLSYPSGIAVDASGNLYIADTGGGKILKEAPSEGSYTETVVGTGLDQCVSVAVDTSGNVYCSDVDDMAVYEFTYSAGSYTKSTVPTTGLNYPYDVAVDASGNLYIDDFSNYRVVKETYISAGNYTQSVFPTYNLGGSIGLALDAKGDLYLADTYAFDVKEVALAGGNFGPVTVPGSELESPVFMLFDFVGGAEGATLAVTGDSVVTQGATGLDYSDSESGNCTATSYSAGDICAVGVNFTPMYPGQRLGAVELVGSSGVLASGYVKGVGTGPEFNFPPGTPLPIANAQLPFGLTNPYDAAVDGSGNVYVADFSNNAVYMETFAAGTYTQTTVDASLSNPEAVAVDGAGNVYVADSGNNRILKETLAGGTWTPTTVATGLDMPTGVAVDGFGNVYYSSFTDGAVYLETLSQSGSYSQSTIVTGLNQPRKIALDASGNVYIADTGNSRVVMEAPSGSGYTQTTLGSGLQYPYGVGVEPSGNVLIADTVNDRIVEEVLSDGTYTQSVLFNDVIMYSIQVDGQGIFYVADAGTTSVWKVDATMMPSLSFASTNVGSTSSDSPQTLTLKNAGNASFMFAVPGSGNNPSVSSGYLLTSGGEGNCPLVASSGSAQPLATGASCTLPVSFHPVAAGADSGTLTLLDNNLNAYSSPGDTQSIPLSGQGNATMNATTTTAMSATASFKSSAQNVTLSAMVTSTSGTVNAGTVTFTVQQGSTTIGQAVTSSTVTSGAASVSYALPAGTVPGSYAIETSYSGGGSFTGSTGSPQTLTVAKAAAAVDLTSSANPAMPASAVEFTATVSSGAGTPAGSVNFFDGSTSLGSGTLNGSGVATYSTSSLAAGSHSITAVYGGNSDFLTATSSAVTEVISGSAFTLGVSGGGSGSTQTVSAGQAATYSFTIQAQHAALDTAVVFSATGLPSGATATFSPASITPGLTASTFTMKVQTSSARAMAAAAAHRDLLANDLLVMGLSPFMLGMLLLPFSGNVRRAVGRRGGKLSMLLLIVAGTALVGLSGCGGSSVGSSTPTGKSYTITVTGTDGSATQSTTVTLIVK